MKNILWFTVGVAAGFVAAHQVNKTQQGQQFFATVDARAKEFGKAVADGYHAREAELRAMVDEVVASAKEAAAETADELADAAEEVAEAAEDAKS
ncbi:ATPase [Agromyces sp. SYSU T00194]|uniref:ATPase n=1 Tax=Agromyces chitinivorans TaxID=3158560 RepID=UPI0033928164